MIMIREAKRHFDITDMNIVYRLVRINHNDSVGLGIRLDARFFATDNKRHRITVFATIDDTVHTWRAISKRNVHMDDEVMKVKKYSCNPIILDGVYFDDIVDDVKEMGIHSRHHREFIMAIGCIVSAAAVFMLDATEIEFDDITKQLEIYRFMSCPVYNAMLKHIYKMHACPEDREILEDVEVVEDIKIFDDKITRENIKIKEEK